MTVEPTDVAWGVELTPEAPPDRMAALAEESETAGFDAAFVSSHYFNRDPWVTLALMAEATTEIALGPGVVNPYDTHPARIAAAVATLSEVSDGRAVCGLGAGDRSALAALGIEHDRPLRRVLETMELVRELWDGESVTRESVVTVRDASLALDPVDVPVFVGAQGPDMLGMSAVHADGVLINAAHPRDLSWAADRLESASEDRVADRGPFQTLAFASTSVAESADAAREAARPPVAFITAGAPEPVIEGHGIDPAAATAVRSALESGEPATAFDRVTPRMVDAFCVAGTVETVAERLTEMTNHVDGVVFGSPLGPDRSAAIEACAEAIERTKR